MGSAMRMRGSSGQAAARVAAGVAVGFAAGFLAVAVVAPSWLPGRKTDEKRVRDLCGAQLDELGVENLQLKDRLQEAQDAILDTQFAAGHATLRLREIAEVAPDYDFERFLSRNPAASKYFPGLLDAVERYRNIWPVDPMFALAILKQESDFGRHVVSKAGALGDAQFIESTGRRYGLEVQEPQSWKIGRRHFSVAAQKRKEAYQARNRFLTRATTGLDVERSQSEARRQLENNVTNALRDLQTYADLLRDAEAEQALGEESYEIYRDEITAALAEARELGRQVRTQQRRVEEIARKTGIRGQRSTDELEIEADLVVNDYLAQVDPRLSPMLLTDALVHHLADLFVEFQGDERLVASRYNASRRAMEAAVTGLGGGVGIPLLDETQSYVNRVYALQAFFAVDAGILSSDLTNAYCTQYAAQ